MIQLFLVPISAALLFSMLNGYMLFRNRKQEPAQEEGSKRPPLHLPLLVVGCEVAFLLLFRLLHYLLMAGDDYEVSWQALAAFCIAIDGAAWVHTWFSDAALRKVTKRIAMAAVLLFVVEFFVFNCKSITTNYREETYGPATFAIDEKNEKSKVTKDYALIDGNTLIDIADPPDWAHCVQIDAQQEFEGRRPFLVKLFLEDGNFRLRYMQAGCKMTSGYGRKLNFTVNPFEEFVSLRVDISSMTCKVKLYNVIFSNKVPFHFDTIRYVGILAVLALCLVILQFRLQYVKYDSRNTRHDLAIYIVSVLCVLSSFMLWIPNVELVSYPDNFNVKRATPYDQTFDAFENGRLWIDVELDEKLAALGDQLYDRSVRDEPEIKYAWDRAYYNGKMYAYFGAGPIVSFYYPFYWITGKLPTLFHVNFFFSFFSIIFLCLTIVSIVRLYCKDVNLLILLLLLPAATMLCGDYYFMQFPNQYNIVVSSGFCYMLVSVWAGFRAVIDKTKWRKIFWLILSGVFCALCAACRPCMVLGCLALVPSYLGILANKEESLRFRLGQAASFLVPVTLGAAAIMAYNAARFSSPFDFGESYQLTVSNIRANKLRIMAFPAAMFHYFFQQPTVKNVFPFITYSKFDLENYGSYKYYENIIGTFQYPVFGLSFLQLPRFMKKQNGIGGTYNKRQTKIFVAMCYITAVLICWIEFCKGGVSLRYQTDMIYLIVFASVITLLSIVRSPKTYTYPITVVAIVASMTLRFMVMLHNSGEGFVDNVFLQQHPLSVELLEDAVIFWD